MFIATLLCDPNKPILDAAIVENLRNAWGGDTAIWLALCEAAEFTMTHMPDNLWQVWEDLQKLDIDLVVQPAMGRRKKVLLADMDSTMIGQECIDELADVAGVGARVKDITARAMNGELDFDTALRERVGLLTGQDAVIINRVLDKRITLTPGGAALLATMRKNGAYTALVSGGFTAFTEYVADKLNFDEHRANTLLMENGKLSGQVGHPILGREAKITALNEIVAHHAISAVDVMAVGDGANDLGMLDLAGTGVALHAKPAVAAQCNIRINYGDLTALLFIQGYAKSEFSL